MNLGNSHSSCEGMDRSIQTKWIGKCPCGCDVSVSKNSLNPIVYHSRPHCKEFQSMDFVEYLNWLMPRIRVED